MPDFGIFRGFGSKLFSDKLYAGQLPTQLGVIGSEEVFDFIWLLDAYPNAAAAYSLRKLRSAYTGSAIRVRRASDNTEQDIGFVNNELDTASLTSFCSGTNGFVKTWYDQSGNGRDAGQTTAANQPQIVSSGSVILENNKPSIRFIAANPSYLRNTSSFSYQTTFTLTRFITRTDAGYLISAESAIQKGITDLNGTGYRIFANVVLYANINPSLTNQDLIYGLFDGVNSQISVDNSNIVTGDTGTSSATGIIIGVARNINIGSEFDGTMQEIITYDSNQSTNRTAIKSNINSFYSIY